MPLSITSKYIIIHVSQPHLDLTLLPSFGWLGDAEFDRLRFIGEYNCMHRCKLSMGLKDREQWHVYRRVLSKHKQGSMHPLANFGPKPCIAAAYVNIYLSTIVNCTKHPLLVVSGQCLDNAHAHVFSTLQYMPDTTASSHERLGTK